MVDVMFLLLVFYVLSTVALTVGWGIPVALPEASTAEGPVVEETVVTIDSEGRTFLNREPVELERLGVALTEFAEARDGGLEKLQAGYVVLNVDMEVPHRTVVSAMNQLRGVGISDFSISTEGEGT